METWKRLHLRGVSDYQSRMLAGRKALGPSRASRERNDIATETKCERESLFRNWMVPPAPAGSSGEKGIFNLENYMSEEKKQEYLEFAKQLAQEAGEIMSKYFLATNTEWKADATPLTQADTEINSLVIQRIAAAYPEHSVLGEEESAMQDSSYTWVCDPVDGTMPYSHGLPISTFSLALCEDGVPQVGVVYDPFMKRLFYATVGGGAFCNDDPIRVNRQELKNALIEAAAFPAHPSKMAVDCGNGIYEYLENTEAKVVRMWSTILPTCLVALGSFSATMLNITLPEDAAAIKVIVEEAGGRVTDLYGNDQRYDQPTKGFIASNGVIHDELVKIVKEASR